MTQRTISELFGVKIPAISKHLKNIYESKELRPEATVSKMETVQMEGDRQVTREIEVYNLDAAIAVGYRVNSIKTTDESSEDHLSDTLEDAMLEVEERFNIPKSTWKEV